MSRTSTDKHGQSSSTVTRVISAKLFTCCDRLLCSYYVGEIGFDLLGQPIIQSKVQRNQSREGGELSKLCSGRH